MVVKSAYWSASPAEAVLRQSLDLRRPWSK